MKLTGTRMAVTAMVAVGAFCVGAVGTGVADGATHPAAAKQAKLPGTFQMYANVDQLGDLGSNVGAKGAQLIDSLVAPLSYTVTFKRPIGSCAAQAVAGYAGGHLKSGFYIPQVTNVGSNAFDVAFQTPDGTGIKSAFMLTVTCPS